LLVNGIGHARMRIGLKGPGPLASLLLVVVGSLLSVGPLVSAQGEYGNM